MKKYINRRNIALILVLVTLITCIQLPRNIAYGELSYSGQTTIGNYSIGTTAQLDLLAQKVNSGTTYEGSTFILTKNITYDSSIQNNYTPIGNATYKFKGTFDGNRFYVSGINIYFANIDQKIKEQNYKGIFGNIENATIKNLGLVNSSIEAHTYIGGICGYATTSTIENCYNSSKISSGYRINNSQVDSFYMAAGILGYGYNVTIKGCYNEGNINGEWHSGIVAKLYNTSSSRNMILDCINYGAIIGASWNGGITAYAQYTNFENCINYGNFNNSNNTYTGGIVADMEIGDIYYCKNYGSNTYAGIVSRAEYVTIYACENFKNARSSGIANYIDRGSIIYCANFGNISSAYAAGIVRSPIRTHIIQNYNTGNIYGSSSYKQDGDWVADGFSVGIAYEGNAKSNVAYTLANYNVGGTTGYGLSGRLINDKNINLGGTLASVTGFKDFASYTAKDINSTAGLLTESYMKSQAFVDNLNSALDSNGYNINGLMIDKPFVKSTTKNNGYPIFWYQVTVESITIDGLSTVNKGDTTVLKAIINPENAPNKTLTWTTSDSNIADIIPVGNGETVIIQGIRKGTVTITVKAQDGSGVTASKTINVVSNFASSVANYILVDDVVQYITAWKDTEKDPLFKEEYKYIHTPSTFKDGIKVDNSMGNISYNNTWIGTKYTHFSKVGTYKIQYRVQDNPPTANTLNFENYRYYSDYVENIIYVHRKPIAIYSITNEIITDSSYDLDHSISYSNKGIAKWDWTCVSNTGIVAEYTVTDKNSGVNSVNSWINTYKTLGYKIILRVQDIEGAWSEPCIKGAGEYSKPIAFFTIDKNPMIYPSDIQTITDMSYDTNGLGLALTYDWTVLKNGTNILSSTSYDISTTLNQKIKALYPNITGIYDVSLRVTNSAGIASNIFTKSFEVKVENSAPTVNFDLVSNQNPTWTFPKILGLYTLNYRPSNTLFSEEYSRFDTYINDPNTDNTGFIYSWKLERFAVKDISNISGTATNTYNYSSDEITVKPPFTNSFKNQGLGWGAYKITLRVTDKPPIPPYVSTDAKTTEITKYYYIVPETSLVGSFESLKTEIMVGNTITLKAITSKHVGSVNCSFAGTTYHLSKSSEDGSFIYWKKDIVIPDNITESGTYNLQFIGKTTYGGNGNVTREVRDNTPINIIALKLINFRITNIINHIPPTYNFPYRYEKGELPVQDYKTGYNVTFQIDSKGKPDNVYGRIDIGNNGTIEQNITLTKVVTGDTETWQGRFYTTSLLPSNTVISIKTDCIKGSTTYNYNEKENWDGRSLITNGSALQDGRINLTN